MRIAHINNIANVSWRLAEAQRRLGHEAVVFSLDDNPFHFPYDVRIAGAKGPLRWNAAMLRRIRTFASFDVLHVHGGIWISQLFYPLFKRIFPAKAIAVHYHGSETRFGLGLHHISTADVRFHSTPDLGSQLPGSIWIPNPIDVAVPPPPPDNAVPIFAHFPTKYFLVRGGTERVIELFRQAFGPLETKEEGRVKRLCGRQAELWIGQGMAHEEVLDLMRRCDALIEQISEFGTYGVTAIEAMAYAKPVIGSASPDLYSECPMIRIQSPDVIARMRELTRDDNLRREIGKASHAYVERVHESGTVARTVLRTYYEALRQPALTSPEARVFWSRRGRTYANELSSPGVRAGYEAQAAELLQILGTLSFDSVTEVGCGYGRIGRHLAGRNGKKWIGADLSRAQLQEARRREASLAPRLLQASADGLPLRDRSSDLVLAVELLMHIPTNRIEAVLRELWRVSRRYIVHLDWFEDYLKGFETGWCWVHDYSSLWKSMGIPAKEIRLKSSKLQSVFVVEKPRTRT